MLEEYFDCPYCWENQLKMVDPSVKNQNFIEDCEVCCNPIDFQISIENFREFSDFFPDFFHPQNVRFFF